MERTADQRYIVISGRRWRATDPSIPEVLRIQLVKELMAARRAVRDADGRAAEAEARRRVDDAKISLGERGRPWWERHESLDHGRCAATARTLLRNRDADKTICPSEVARIVASPSWRSGMSAVRDVLDVMVVADELELRQRGAPVHDPATVTGPIRYGRGTRFPDPT